MFKGIPTTNVISNILTNYARSIKFSYDGLKRYTANSKTPVATNASLEIMSSLRNWAQNFNLGLIAEGEKLIHKANATHVIYVSPVDGPGPLQSHIASTTCVVTVMEVNERGDGCPVSAVIFDPINRHIWTAERKKGVCYRNLNTGSMHKLLPFCTEKPIDTTVRIHIGNWDKPCVQLRTIYRRLSWHKNFVTFNLGTTALAGVLSVLSDSNIHGCLSLKKSAAETAALSLFMNELGGIVTDISGKEISNFPFIENTTNPKKHTGDFVTKNGILLVRNQYIHAKLLNAIMPKKPTTKACPL